MLEIESHGDVERLRFSTFRSRLFGYSVSCYAVRGMLVDCAFHDVGDELAAWIAARRPRGVIVTHAHDDHASNAERLAAAGVPVVMPPDTERILRAPESRGLYRRVTWGPKALLRSPLVPFDISPLQLVPTRGHSHDHHVVWDPECGDLFAADLFIGVKVRVAHGTRREDVRAQPAALRAALALAPQRVFDAHRGLLADPIGLLTAKLNWLEETIGAIDRRISEGWSDSAILRDVMGGEEWLGYLSFGDYSRRAFVQNVRATHRR